MRAFRGELCVGIRLDLGSGLAGKKVGIDLGKLIQSAGSLPLGSYCFLDVGCGIRRGL